MALKMNAAIVEEFGEPFVLPEWDIPSPSVGQIQVKTEACGVYQTDLHAARGDWPVKPTLPFIPGHEAIGVVTIVGPGVTIVKEGDRVGAPWLYSACGHCEHCLTGWETVCAGAQFGGYTRNGGFAECLLADLNYVAHVTAGLGAKEAAFRQGVAMTRKRGTCVLVGLPPGEFPVPLLDVVANCITIRGSFVGTRQDMAEALAFAADIELQPLSSINQIFDRLEHGDVASRVVLEFTKC
jgi:D-arabinose 1-dehydrogenase-like Zn-dependent alcohol dehydrogenase